MVSESMNKTVVTEEVEERAYKLGERLKQIDALVACTNALVLSSEGSLYVAEVSTLMGLSRELITECRNLNHGI